MGSGAMQKLSEASQEEVSAAYQDLSPEEQAKLKEALAALKANENERMENFFEMQVVPKESRGLVLKNLTTGQLTTVYVKAESTYMDVVKALNLQIPDSLEKVVKFTIPHEPMDEYKTLGEQGVDIHGIIQYTLEEFALGTQLTAAEAGPIVEGAAEALNGLNAAAIQEVKSLKNPPAGIKLVVTAVTVLLGNARDDWDEVRKTLADKEFLQKLVSFPKDEVSLKTLVELRWYLNHPNFDKEKLRKSSLAATCLRDWVDGIATWATTKHRIVVPFSLGTKLTPEEAAPILEALDMSLDDLKKPDVQEVTAMKFPPDGVKVVVSAVATLMGKPRGDWSEARNILEPAEDFLQNLKAFEADNVPIETLAELHSYLGTRWFVEKDEIKKISIACTRLRDWVENVNTYATTKHRLALPE